MSINDFIRNPFETGTEDSFTKSQENSVPVHYVLPGFVGFVLFVVLMYYCFLNTSSEVREPEANSIVHFHVKNFFFKPQYLLFLENLNELTEQVLTDDDDA